MSEMSLKKILIISITIFTVNMFSLDAMGCLINADCNDNNTCTVDTCDNGTCTNNPVIDGTICNDSLYCTDNDTCIVGACTGGPARNCSGLGNQCNNGICDEVLDLCVGQPKADGTLCNDGLYCTQVDTCEVGQCLGSSDPCPDNATYCDGVEYCAEDIAGYLCNSAGNPCGLLTCNEFGGVCTGSEVILSIGNAVGYSGTIDIGLDNSANLVGAVHLDVCDIDQRGWLHIASDNCSTTVRSSSFSCAIMSLGGGCAHLDLTTATGFIDIGTGAVARLNYTIDSNAPLTDYADINPEVIDVRDDNATTLSVTPLPGTVRAVECVSNADCNDNNICTDDTCAANACQYANNTNTCNDGLYCTDNDTCSGGVCGGLAKDCAGAGDECNDGICDEVLDQCVAQPKTDGTICNDGLYCTDNDTCSGGVCGGQAKDCAGAGDECNDGICDEGLDQCVAQPKTNGTICNDGLYCTDNDTCVAGACTGGPARDCSGLGNQCNNGICDDVLDQCVGQPKTDGTICNDGLYCTQVDTCEGGQCLGSSDPCSDNTTYCDGVEYCAEDIAGYLCTSTGNPCGLLACNEFGGICTGSEVILSIASALGYAGTMDIELDNSAYLVGSVHLDVCDIDQRSWLNIDSANCSTTARSSAFSCGVIALGGGCVHVDLTTATGFIDIGTGAVARLNYTIDSNAPLTDYADINPEVIDIKDDNGTTLSVTPLPGTVRAVECVADADCNDNNICTDDTCAANACQYANNTNTCDDGLYCTDNDTCSGGTCGGIAHDCTGAGDQCNDGICDEALDQCVVQPKANGTICNDGLYCTDNDICAAGVCGGQAKDCAGAGDECNDGICDEALDQCVGQPKANGTICDDGLYCNGSDTCIGGICSSHSGTPCPDDGLYCNGSESCDEAGDQCLHSGSPCSETECNTCQEATDSCFDVAGTSCADDGNICTDDQCDGSGTCVHLNNTVPCEDGLYCTINDICSGGACLSGLARNCGGAGDECNDGICDDAIDQCVGQPKANGTVCDDGLYCTLNDTCSGGTCAGTARDCTGAGDQCNYGICDDTIDQCVGQPKANGTVCDDGLYCSLIDICSGGVCTSAMARDCSGLGDQCNDGICDEGLDQCVVQLKQDGTICNDGQYCNGSDTCIGGVCSIHSGVPCPDDGLYCNGSESCDEAGDQCSHSGSPCSGPSVCVEGIGQYECSTQWARHYRGSNEDFAQSVRQTSDGGYILAGYSNSFGTGGENALIMKFSSDGNVSWQKTYGGSSYDRANMIQQTSDGGYIFSGFTLSFGSGGEDAWAVKLDSNGDVSWQKTYGGISDDRANAILQTSDGGYVMTGYTNSFGLGGSDAWVVKLDISGNVTWQKTYGVDNNDYFDYIQQTWDGGYIVVGRSDSFGTIGDNIWVLRLNSSGNINWQKFYDWSINGRVYVIRQTSDGGYIMAGYTNSFGAGGDDVWVLKLNSSGNVSWQKTYGGASEEKCSDIQNTSDGGYVLAGYTLSFGNNQKRDFWILKINTNGGVDWGKTYGSPENDFAASIQQTMDGGYVVAGRSYSFGSGDSDLWVLKLDAFGDINVCDIIGNCNAVVNDSSISFQQTLAGANISSATVTNISYLPQNSSPTIVDICYPNPNDIDGDGTLDNFDNCIEYPNALDLGSCVKAVSGVYAGTGIACTVVSSCATGEICQKNQEDFNLNGIGDACECYADLSGDGRINSSDLLIMKIDYNRNNCYVNPCDADCNDDGKVNSSDLLIMKIQYRRTDCPVL